MHAGHFDEVGFEDLDDIICIAGSHTKYRQVKTKEDGTRHSISTICTPEIKGKPETSIIGRLFCGKPIAGSCSFCLLLNETPNGNLRAFKILRSGTRGPIPDQCKDDLRERLEGMPLPNGTTPGWCIDRFEVLVESRTIDEVEAIILRRLVEPVAKVLGSEPLPSELEDILVRLGHLVRREAQAVTPQRWKSDKFETFLRKEIARATGHQPDGSITPLPSLSKKLAPARVPDDEAIAQTEAMLSYRRRYRSAIGDERATFNTLNDHVFATCMDISARRRAGLIADGPPAYAATIQAVKHIEIAGATIPMPDKLAALSDVTARCRNRYSDDS